MAFGFGGLLGGGTIPDVQMPDGLPVSGGNGSPLVDAFLALQAKRIQDAITAPRDAYTGDLQVMGPDGHPTAEAMDRANGMAGLAMTGSMPFKAPKGALRTFGGGEIHDDPLTALSAALDQNAGSIVPDVRPVSRIDPNASSWDLYHGTDAPTDFARFDTALPKAARGHTPDSERGGVFLSPAPDEAAQYSGSIGGRPGAEAGPRVIRATVDPGRTDVFDLPHLMENDPAFVARARQAVIDDAGGRSAAGRMFDERHARMLDEFRSARDLNAQLAEMGYPANEIPQVQWGYGGAGAAMQIARERGLDTAVLRGLSESNGGDQVVALTPGRVRSYYDPDHVLYSGGPAGAAAGLPALASSSDPKGSPVSAGLQMPSIGDLSPEMQAQIMQLLQQGPQAQAAPSPVDSLLFDRQGMGGGANSFSGTAGTIAQPTAPETTGAVPQRRPPIVAMNEGAVHDAELQLATPADDAAMRPPGSPLDAAPQRGAPAMPAPIATPVSAPPAMPIAKPAQVAPTPGGEIDPLTGQPVSGAPKPMGQPAAAGGAKPSGGFDLGSALGRMNQSGLSDQLIAIGAGILSGRGLSDGLGQGLSNALAVSQASGKGELERLKLAKEQAALTGNAQILRRAYPNLSDAELGAMATNSANVTTALQILRDPTHGMPKTPEQMQAEARATAAGSREGGAKPLDRIQAEAQAQSAGSMVGNAKPLDRIEAEAKAQSAGAAAGKPDETYSPLSEADRIARGLPAGAYQVDSKNKVSPVNPTGTTINMGGEKAYDAEVGKTYAKKYTDLQAADGNARNKLNTLALMEQSMNTPGFYSGVGGEGVKRANQFMGALGLKDTKAASGAEVFDALGNQVVLDQLGGSLGAGISDSDRKSIALIGPSITKTPEGNKQLIGIYRSISQREQEIAQMARDYAKANGGRIDAGFDDQVARFAKENPLFPAAQGSATAQSDGVAGPTAANGVSAPRTQADFDALPKGAMYVDPADGRRYRKN